VVNVELVSFGVGALICAIALLYAARALYPRLDVPEETLATIRFLTAIIIALLSLAGIGLVGVGVVG